MDKCLSLYISQLSSTTFFIWRLQRTVVLNPTCLGSKWHFLPLRIEACEGIGGRLIWSSCQDKGRSRPLMATVSWHPTANYQKSCASPLGFVWARQGDHLKVLFNWHVLKLDTFFCIIHFRHTPSLVILRYGCDVCTEARCHIRLPVVVDTMPRLPPNCWSEPQLPTQRQGHHHAAQVASNLTLFEDLIPWNKLWTCYMDRFSHWLHQLLNMFSNYFQVTDSINSQEHVFKVISGHWRHQLLSMFSTQSQLLTTSTLEHVLTTVSVIDNINTWACFERCPTSLLESVLSSVSHWQPQFMNEHVLKAFSVWVSIIDGINIWACFEPCRSLTASTVSI